MFHIFKNDIFTETVTGSTPFHPLVSYLQRRHFHQEGYPVHAFSSFCFISSKRHFHREGYWLHPFSSSCFISSKTTFSLRGLPAPPLVILLLHIFQNDIFTQSVTGSTPFHPHVSFLQKRRFHREGYRLHPFSSSRFISSTTAFSPRRLPTQPLFRLLFHIFKDDDFTERVTGSTPFHRLVLCLQKRHFHRDGYRLQPFSSSCFISSKTTFSPRGLPAPPLFILLFHIFKNGIFTERVTGSTPFFILLFHREGYRLHPLVSYFQKHSKTAFSPRGLPAPPLFIFLFHIFKNGFFDREGYRLHPFSSSCLISSKTAFSPREFWLHPFHPLVSYLQQRHFHPEGYRLHPFFILFFRLHPFSSSCFISSKTTFSRGGLPAPPLFSLLFHIFKNGIFTPRRLPAPSLFVASFISSTTACSLRGLPAPPLFILLFHIFQNDVFTERVTGSTPFSSSCLISSKTAFSHREGYRLYPFSSSSFMSSTTACSLRGLPAAPLFILLFHIFINGIFTERVTGSTRFHPLVSYLQKRHFHREGYRLQFFFILLYHIFKNGIFTEKVTGSTPYRPLLSLLQKRHFHREGYRLHPFSSSLFYILKNGIFTEGGSGSTPFHPLVLASKTAFSPRGLPAPPLFIVLFHIFKNGTFTERVAGSTPFHPLVSYLQK